MHELTISLQAVELVVAQAKKHNANQVVGITLSIGALSCIEETALRTGMSFACRETLAQDAKIEIEIISATGYCLSCQQDIEIKSYQDACPYCQSYEISIATGEELQIKHIEVA